MEDDRNTYLILWHEQVPALDLSIAIRDASPSAPITLLNREDMALDMVMSADLPIVAFVHAEPKAFDRSDLGMALKRRAAKVFLIGGMADKVGPTRDWNVFPVPFSSATVQNLLEAW